MNNQGLDYCPFCGETDEIQMSFVESGPEEYGGFVTCYHCGAKGGRISGLETPEEAVEWLRNDWNRAGRATLWDWIKMTFWIQPLYDVRQWWENLRDR